MTVLASDTVWRNRLNEISNHVEQIHLPGQNGNHRRVDQDQEWCEVITEGEKRRIRFHDYDRIFEIPGLYEELFYKKLKCCSPSYVTRLLDDVVSEFGDDISEFRVLDLGAGNGMVGDELAELGVGSVIGVDLIDEAREATQRDRPELYDDYLVADLTELSERQTERLKDSKINCLTSVAALGFGDIPPLAFLNAMGVVSAPGWLAFNIKEDFLREGDSTGFQRLIRQLSRDEYLQVQCYRRYRHRVSMAGEPLYYVAMVAKKLRPVEPELIKAWS